MPTHSPPASTLPRAVLLAVIAHTLISAGTHLAARAATTGIPPLTVAALRLVGTGLVFVVIIATSSQFRGRRLPPPGARWRFLVWGLIAGPLHQGLFLVGIERSVAAHAALLYALTPIGVYLVAIALRAERWHPGRFLGVTLAFAGVLVLLFERGLDAAVGPLIGDLLLLGSVATWVAWTLANRHLARLHTGLQIAAWTMTAAGLHALLISPFVVDLSVLPDVPPAAWASLAYLIAMTSVVSYILWSFALVRAEASRVAVFTNLQPIATALLAWMILAEPIGWGVALGGALVIVGVRHVQTASAPPPIDRGTSQPR